MPLNDKLIENVTKLVEANKYLIEGKVWSVCIGLAMKEMMKGVGVEIWLRDVDVDLMIDI